MYPGTFATSTPDKTAIVVADTGASLTYAELDEATARLARVFHDSGLRRGDHVAFLTPNSLELFVTYWAALRSGLYVTGVNYNLSADEAGYIVRDCGARALVASAEVSDLAEALVAQSPGIELRLAFGGAIRGHDSFEDALAKVSAEPLADQRRGADMLYSSGTTGQPKGVKPPLPEHLVSEPGDPFAGVFGPMYGFGPDTVYYSPAPGYHAAPLRFGGIVHYFGGTLVLGKKFDAVRSLEAVEKYGVTHSQWVPTMFVRMLKLDPDVRASYDVSTLACAIHAAAPCPVDVKQQMIDWWGPVLHEYYGGTEGNGLTLINSEQWLERPGSVGKAGLGTLRICGEDGEVLDAGRVGSVYFERDTMPFAYHNDPDKTRASQHPDHETWTTIGDIGYVDEDGYLFLTDRKAFMIISGGVNIYPQEVEDCLALHPKVLDLAVFGIPDDEMGEQVKAVVQPAPGVETGPALEQELLAFVRDRMAHFKVPRSIDFSESLPRTPTGKLVKGILRDAYVKAAKG
ncbi:MULTISPECIES: acyl-CoA synthetase [unclassified Nocardioides]|uniref:acyl-CoA synthetase n=1 Tax=unclassified Nocardioides TaxID=2615069 RepID=UPI0006F29E92|nr:MULTISPECIES: acyl-CoA synthetase [unclassified Nocardioides]KQY57245.1 acyl-CoA synthetase [Nocardioides sp. Root140]KQZ68760.1 acyl-CoA synthetase [Nocardioides sp. Root151]KRF11889.1 acyl-CoA synthetase [Nocardioides sp. Soil796]